MGSAFNTFLALYCSALPLCGRLYDYSSTEARCSLGAFAFCVIRYLWIGGIVVFGDEGAEKIVQCVVYGVTIRCIVLLFDGTA